MSLNAPQLPEVCLSRLEAKDWMISFVAYFAKTLHNPSVTTTSRAGRPKTHTIPTGTPSCYSRERAAKSTMHPAAEVLWSGAKDENGQNRSQITASPRLVDFRERLLARGVQAEPIGLLAKFAERDGCLSGEMARPGIQKYLHKCLPNASAMLHRQPQQRSSTQTKTSSSTSIQVYQTFIFLICLPSSSRPALDEDTGGLSASAPRLASLSASVLCFLRMCMKPM
ncbi:hypothetical protein HDK77DRAFT_169708 [Phyllosticta capitalensis]